MKKRIIIAGSRHFNDYALFCSITDKIISRVRSDFELVILPGHCRGTDQMAERYAHENGITLEIYPANWKLGSKAGPLRNQAMVDIADYAIAFSSGGQGTKSLISLAQKKGIPLRIIHILPAANADSH